MTDEQLNERNELETSPPDGDMVNQQIEDFINSTGLYFESFGIPRIGGRMLGLLLVTVGPISADEIASRLQVSRASISTNIRLLVAGGLAERVIVGNERRDYYRYPPNAWERLSETRVQGITMLTRLITQGLTALPANHPTREQLDGVREYMNFAAEYLSKMNDAWEEHKARKQQEQS